MSLLIFGIFFSVLWLIIEVMSILLKMTGMDLGKARFQIVSILTHTGFTTRESELIAQHPVRRRIASTLMIISYVSQLTLIGLLIDAFSNDQKSMYELFIVVAVILILITLVSRHKYVLARFDRLAEKILSKRMKNVRETPHRQDPESEPGVQHLRIGDRRAQPAVQQGAPEANLKEKYIQILKIDRGLEVLDFPTADTVILEGDKMVVYGKISSISQCILSK
jgi:hypothetical protein